MLTEEQMQQMDAEVKQRGMGINPDVMPVQDEADNYAFTPEAAVPEIPAPEPAQDVMGGLSGITEAADNINVTDGGYDPGAIANAQRLGMAAAPYTDALEANIKKTNIYKRYAYSKEDVLREAREISIETGIPERAILYSPQTLDNARNVFNYRRRQMDLMPPGSDEVSIDLLTKAYPGLKDIVDNGSEVDAAIALQNIKNVRQVNGLVDAAKTRWRAGWMQHEIANVGRQALRQGRAITDEEFARADKITKQIEDLRETPSFVEDPLLSIVGGTAEQLPQQLRGIGTGALFGTAAAATAVTVGAAAAIPTGGLSMAAAGAAAKTAFGWGMRAGYAVDMWEDSAAQRYIEYSRFKDKDGKRVLTDEEARAYAAVAAAVETGIEFMNAGKIVDVLKGNKSAAARQIRDAVAGATDNATFAASLKRILSGMGEIAISESLEEGGQEASDRILSNVVASFKGGDIPKYTPGEILMGAVQSFAESLPATIGFGLSAAGGGSIGLVRRIASYAELNDLHVKERMKNITGINMIQGMVQDAGIKEFFRKDTDIAKQVLHNTVEGTGYEKVNIDTQMVLDQEGGMNALQEIGKAAGMSADEIQRAVETKADITVPTETYFQMRAENENFAINENLISFSDTAPCFARNQYYANMIKSELDSLMQDMDARQIEQQQAALDMIVQRDFAAGLEQDAAASILAIRPDNPMEGWREMRGMYKQQLDDILAPVIRELKGGMKQGVEIRRDESERDTKYIRESQNADWARKFYAENKRWPTQFELEGMAIDILSGRDFSKLPDYQNRPEMQEFYDSNAEQINDLLQTIDVFDGIREKIAAIDPDELQTMEGMSKEAYDIYRNVAQQLQASAPNDAVKRSAKAGAALLARRADRYAEAMRAAGNTNYTAADYFRDRFGLRVGGTFQGGGSNTVFQENLADQYQYQESPDGSVGVTTGAVELNAATARDKDTQNYLRQIMAQKGLTEKDQQDAVLGWIEKYVSIAEELLEKHPSMEEWHKKAFQRFTVENGLPVPPLSASAFKNNGEYDYNIDLGSLCTKREALDSLIQILVDKGMSQKIGPTQYTALSDMLAEMGFLTHCKICFVEGKRVRVLMDANKFSFEWRSVLRALGIDDDNVVGDERHFTAEQKADIDAKLAAMTDVTPVPVIDPKTGQQKMKKVKDKKTGEEKLVPETEKAFKLAYRKFMPPYARRQTGDAGITPDKMFMIAKLFKEDERLIGIFKPEWLQTSRGTSWLINEFPKTSIKSVLAGMYGAATSKPLEYYNVYDPLSWALAFDKKRDADALVQELYDIGGVRAQSFTDFNPMLFVDYVQMVADLAVRKLPMHVYTKVPSFVKLFGETGMMINMSLVARVDPNTDAEHAGLVWNPETKEWDYAWADESFPVEEAFALRQNPKYGGRVGTIAVALSDEHMKKLLADPRIDQVIPFHKSGMSEEVLAMTGLNRAKDFTNEQTEKNVPKGMSVISYNALLQEHKDPRKATAAYLEWCDKNGVTPTFKDYINNPNYYKLQEDFRGYDNNNKPVIQGAVRMQLPENAKEILDEAWAERGAYMEKIDELKNNPQFIDKAMKRLEPQHIDGEVRKEMLRRLRNIMGSKNVITLQQGAFLDALEKSEAQTMGETAAKNHVEIFRNGQGIVYGFTHNGKIYLNENTMNANTPAHEFTHVWVNVARKVNPKLWNHGKSMLKDTYEWVQVTHDPLYKNIRGDEEAIASEVLARIVGRENESFVRDFMDKGQLEKQIRIDHQDNPKERDRLLKFVKYGTGKTLRKQIMDWFKELWGSVRSLFDPVKKGQYPTYDEFIHMPLKDLWDSTAEGNKTSTTDYSKRFAKALSEIYKNGGIEDMPASEYGNRGGNRGMEQVAASATELQAAYHGTPSRFDRFDTGHIGEGEGAQVHGWGIYFAENREVAEGYRNRLTDNDYKVTFTGKPLKSKQKLIDAAITEIRWGLNEGLSVDEAIQKRIDFYRDQLQFFEDHPKQATKSKIKNAQDKMDFFAANSDKFKAERQGQVFKVEIPDNDVLLDEQKIFDEQPEKVKAGIQKLLDDYQNRYSYKKAGDEYIVYEGDREIDRYEDEEDAATAVRENNEALANQLENRGLSGDELKNSKGRAIYLKLSGIFLEFDDTSKKLNEYGIKGITYDGFQDGRCYVVFDDKAIDILDQYYQRQQRQGDTIQGATEFEDNGRRIISIFESGNESTMAHELGHIFVADLKELAEMPNAPAQIVKDWETVKKWIGWKNGQKNFTTAQQEKFARGFEAYLRSGEAPATGLKKVFRDFKRWLTKIYKDFLSLGGKPSADVQAVMGRMLATEQEVENAFKIREAENFEKAGGFDYLAKDSQEMYQRWQNEAQEYAKEKVLAQAMKDLKAQRANELAAVRDQMEQDIRAQLQQEPLYQAEALVTQNPKIVDMWPAEALGMTYDEYTQAIAEQGTLDKAVQTAVDAAMKEVEEGLPEEEIKQAAEAAVNSSEYRGMYLAFEQDFIEKKLRRDETLNNRIEKALDEIEKAAYDANIETVDPQGKIRAGEPETDTPAKRKIRELKYQARWNEAEMKAINRMELAASRDELQAAVRDFKAIFRKTRQDVRVYRDTAVQKYKLIKQYAAENMAEMPISEATNVAKWAALEKRAGRESIEAMKRAIDAELKYQPEEKGLVTTEPASDETLPAERKAKESPADLWRQANEAKLRQRVFAEYAAMAQKNKDYIRKKNARLQARSKTIAKNNNMPANERYMYNHGLYVLGLNKQDAPMPQEPKSIMEMIQGYKDNLQAFFVDEDGNISMPDYAISAMTGNTAYNGGYQNLTMEQYQYFNDMLTAIYKAGIDANKVKSMKDINGNSVLISDVNAAIVDETNARVPLIMTNDVTNAGTPTFAQSIQNKARRARVELTKPETILDMMGPTAYRYIYETVNQSWNKEQGMLEESAKVMQSIWAPYSNTEKSEMRSKKQYRFGTSILTKEEMICVAFNWGTEINRKRIMDGFGVDEMTVNELLSNLTQKDWQMVSSVWELVNSYWPETARVEESMTGIAPQKQTAMPFEITGKDGQVYKLQGGYYPIKYDPSKSLKAANQQQDDMAKQYAANNAAMNRNRGFTKQRVQGTVARPVLLSFNVLNRHISDVVHNICFRESLRDVNRIIKSPEVSQVLQDHFGIDQTRALEQWVRDCWAPDVAKKDVFASSMEFFRHKQTAAALGYRMTTAALNALNIYPMTDYLGATRTVETLQKFYSDPKANWDFAVEHSIFLRQRAETMDRDAGEVLRKEFVGGYGTTIDTLIRGEKALEKHAFDALAFTDMLLAAPLWTAEYQRIYQEMTAEMKGNMDADAWFRIEMEAVAAGDKAVRKVFGSGEMKDLAPVQKGGEITKALTMFYSYFNVVFNALYSGYGEGRRQAMGTDSKILIAPLAQKFVFWIVMTGVTEGLMRTAIDALSGNGGDEPEDWMKAMFKGVNDNIAGTIPVFRDMWSRLIDRVMGERDYGSRALPAYTVFDNILKLSNTISSDKKSKIDVFREGAKITNGMTGIGNTVTDAIATTAYWADTDFDAPLYQYLAAVFFDKRLDRKKKK